MFSRTDQNRQGEAFARTVTHAAQMAIYHPSDREGTICMPHLTNDLIPGMEPLAVGRIVCFLLPSEGIPEEDMHVVLHRYGPIERMYPPGRISRGRVPSAKASHESGQHGRGRFRAGGRVPPPDGGSGLMRVSPQGLSLGEADAASARDLAPRQQYSRGIKRRLADGPDAAAGTDSVLDGRQLAVRQGLESRSTKWFANRPCGGTEISLVQQARQYVDHQLSAGADREGHQLRSESNDGAHKQRRADRRL